jgi:hypothetical protein
MWHDFWARFWRGASVGRQSGLVDLKVLVEENWDSLLGYVLTFHTLVCCWLSFIFVARRILAVFLKNFGSGDRRAFFLSTEVWNLKLVTTQLVWAIFLGIPLCFLKKKKSLNLLGTR